MAERGPGEDPSPRDDRPRWRDVAAALALAVGASGVVVVSFTWGPRVGLVVMFSLVAMVGTALGWSD